MSKKRKNRNNQPKAGNQNINEKVDSSGKNGAGEHGENVIDELFGKIDSEPDIETDIADLGTESEDDTVAVELPKKRHKRFFALAVFIVIMSVVGIVSTVKLVISGIGSLIDNTSLKNEFTRFILPVVANDIAPFENESEISNAAKVNCAIWNILLNKDTSQYKLSDEGDLIIPEYDVSVSYKDIFGSDSSMVHQTSGNIEMRFSYDEENHVYSCPKNFRYLNYAPKIVDMTETSGIFTLQVQYLPPSISIVAENIGIDVSPDKTMEYEIKREDGKDTIIAIRFPETASESESR